MVRIVFFFLLLLRECFDGIMSTLVIFDNFTHSIGAYLFYFAHLPMIKKPGNQSEIWMTLNTTIGEINTSVL